MGEHIVQDLNDKKQLRRFTQHLFNDIKALDIMIKEGMIEEGITRIGAEQEISLINKHYRPASKAMEMLERINDPHFTTELSLFNLEANLDPLLFNKEALPTMEAQLKELLKKVEIAGEEIDVNYVLVGILPTIRRSDLDLKNITPVPRYKALNDTIKRMRGGKYEFRIQGLDELITNEDTFMFESCNTSFQVHYQVGAKDFVPKYNWAQAISGPVLAGATNSPMMLGRRLWRETRIAIFQQATDTRSASEHMRDQVPRVLFGNDWVKDSVVDIFKEDITRYRVLVSSEIEEDSLNCLEAGRVPKLKALMTHNGTIYKWNRACYGITNGKPHLRIENRLFPSGPTVLDEMANTAFWLGLMHGMPEEYRKLHKKADFDNTKGNFFRAAKMGLGAMFRWVDDKVYSAQDLICKELIPIAEDGLKKSNVKKKDIDRYLNVIRERVESGRTGSQWMLDSFSKSKKRGTKDEALVAIAAGIANRQNRGKPVHKWGLAKIDEAGSWENRYWQVEQIMNRDVYTIREDDLVDLLPNIMTWKEVRHLAVDNEEGDLVGMITSSTLLKHYSVHGVRGDENLLVKHLMKTNVITVTPETLTIDAINQMRNHNIGWLPVVKDGKKLVGVVTERHFLNVADHFLNEFWSKRNEENNK